MEGLLAQTRRSDSPTRRSRALRTDDRDPQERKVLWFAPKRWEKRVEESSSIAIAITSCQSRRMAGKKECMGRGRAQPSTPSNHASHASHAENFEKNSNLCNSSDRIRPKFRSAANLYRVQNSTILFFEAMHSASMGSVKRIENIQSSEATESLTRPAGRRCHPGPSDQETK